MSKIKSLLSAALLASAFFWDAPLATGQETNAQVEAMIFRVATEDGSYCHLKFPMIREDTLSWQRPVFGDGPAVIDFYGPCNHDPLGRDEVHAQRQLMDRVYDDAE